MNPRTEQGAEVIVIGAGPAGSAAALSLARAGLETLLVGRGDERQDRIGETLPPSVGPLLKRLGLMSSFLATEPRPCYGNRSAWGGDGRLAEHEFIGDRHGHGWHVDRRRFDEALREAARAAGARPLPGLTLRRAERIRGGWRLGLRGEAGELEISARIVLDATGRSSAFARRLGVRRRHLDRLVSVVAFLEPEGAGALDAATLVEATPRGWWYSATLPDGRMVVAYMTDPDLLADQRGWTTAGWLSLLAETCHTRGRVRDDRYQLLTAPRVAPAGNSRLPSAAGEGWVAVGDAAVAYDPLSSHGIASALSGGLRAAAAARAEHDGSEGALAEYAQAVARSYARYLEMWQSYYASETRWPDAPFWRRRQRNRERTEYFEHGGGERALDHGSGSGRPIRPLE